MGSANTRRIVRALLSSAVAFASSLGFGYVRDVIIDHGTFAPNWFETILLTVLVFPIAYSAPDAAQRKRNREELKNRLLGGKKR